MKNRIVIENSSIKVLDYEEHECPDLERNFKIWNMTTHSLEPIGIFYDKENKILHLPRGIDIWYVKKQLQEENVYYERPNIYDTIDDIRMKYQPRDNEQIEALKFMCGLGPDYENNYSLSQLSVNLNTGKGKTYCSIATISFIKIKSIIITYSNSLLNQWKDCILEYTNLTENDILFMSGSQTLNMILNNKSSKAKTAKIFLCTHSTIQSFCNNYGWDKLNQIFSILGIGMKFIDEAHLNFANMAMIDFYSNVFKTFYITATPQRSDREENKVFQLYLKNIPSIDLFDSDNDPRTDYIAIKYNSRPSPMQSSNCMNYMYGLDRNKYINYVTQQDNFYKVLNIIMDIINKSPGRALFYIGTNEGILRVYKWLGDHYSEYINDIGIFTSLVSPEEKKIEKEKTIILSTTKSAGLGEDIHDLKYTIVLAEPFKSAVIARQTLGRTRNRNTTYIEIVDLGFNSIKKFYYSKLGIFNKYALSTSDTIIDQYELDRRNEIIIEERSKRGTQVIFLHDERFFDYPDED